MIMIKTNCVLLLLVIFNSVLSKSISNEENGYANHRITRSSGSYNSLPAYASMLDDPSFKSSMNFFSSPQNLQFHSQGHVMKRATKTQQQFDIESLDAKFTDFIKGNNNNVTPHQQINIESLRGRFSDFIRANSMKPLGPQTGNVIPSTANQTTPSTTTSSTPRPTPRTPRPTPGPTPRTTSSAPIKKDDDEYALYDIDVRFNKD